MVQTIIMKFCDELTTLCIAGVLSLVPLIIAAYVPNACYITPSELSSQEVSPCTQLKYHYDFHCSVKTVNQLIDSVENDSFRLIIFLPGMHYVQGTRKSKWLVNPSHNITFKGIESNVTVFCKKSIIFVLINVRYLVISGIHFQNCSGVYKNQDNRITFFFIAHQNHHGFVSLINIHITSRNSEGIKMKFKYGNYYFGISNSTLSTGNNGVRIYDEDYNYISQSPNINVPAYVVNVTNIIIFNGSCLLIESSRISFDVFKVFNTTFIGCDCSPALSIIGIKNFILRDMTFNTTRSQTVFLSSASSLHLQGNWYFYHNKGGVAITSNSDSNFSKSIVKFVGNNIQGNVEFDSIIVINSRSTLNFKDSHVFFERNQGNLCGGLMVKGESSIHINDYSTANFIGNRGTLGGAISLYSLSVLKVSSVNVTLWFTSNEAQKGGAIFIQDSIYAQAHGMRKPAIVIVGNSTQAKLKFDRNTATVGGNNIYGGWIDWSFSNGTVAYTDQVSNSFEFTDSDQLGIASDPIRICVCINGQPDCTIINVPLTIFSGNAFQIDIVAVGQNYGTVQALVEAKIQQVDPHDNNTQPGSLEEAQAVQKIEKVCTRVKYSITSTNSEQTLLISVYENSAQNHSAFPQNALKEYPNKLGLLFSQFKITAKIINIPDCLPPFELNETEFICVCPLLLTSVGLRCDANELSIIRTKQQWIGINIFNINGTEVIVHEHCPYDYCRKDIRSILIGEEYQNLLCSFNRTGILCGGCQVTFSRVLGSSKCKQCSNLMLLAIIPADLVAGLLLIIILMILNLTVSVGTINGLIFYANAIQAQRTAFFPSDISASFLSFFVAWLNLDQGVETCLYDGLDSYTEIWLQFCFPLYVGLLMICIIISSHYSVRISRLSSKNTVQVLATLYLLSYIKLLRLISDVACSATITYPNGHTNKVWLYDGNINYLKGKHIVLFITTLLLIVLLSVPYTLSLVSIQWLMKLSHYRVMFWMNKMKPLFDAYTGPFKPNHCYWTGLLLIIRIILLVVFALNKNSSSNVNLICITVFSFVLLAWLYLTGWIYESLLNNCLELVFLLNLGLTSSATLFYRNPSTAVICTSTGIAFITFVGIIFYHIQQWIFLSRYGKKLKKKLCKFRFTKCADHEGGTTNTNLQTCSPRQVTYTVVELTEPLLESEEEKDSQAVKVE